MIIVEIRSNAQHDLLSDKNTDPTCIFTVLVCWGGHAETMKGALVRIVLFPDSILSREDIDKKSVG